MNVKRNDGSESTVGMGVNVRMNERRECGMSNVVVCRVAVSL